MEAYICSYCPCSEQFCAPSQKLLERHIKLAHTHEPGFRIKCSHLSCSRFFTNYRTYQNHLRLHKSGPEDEGNNIEHEVSRGCIGEIDSEIMEVQNNCENADTEISPNLTDYCARWILKTSETRKLTRVATVGIVEDVSELVKEVVSCVETQVKGCLENGGINFTSIPGLCDIFSHNNEVVTPLSPLMTFHQQLMYYKRNYNFIVSLIMFTLL